MAVDARFEGQGFASGMFGRGAQEIIASVRANGGVVG